MAAEAGSGADLEQGVGEIAGVERLKVIGLFADTDEFHGDTEFALDGDDDTAFGGAIELGDDQAGELADLVEFAGLVDGVLTRGTVEDEQHFVRSTGQASIHHPMYLGQFLHEVVLGMETTGGVDEEIGGVAGERGRDGIVGDGGGIGLIGTGDDGNVEALPPEFELFDGGGAKGVAGGEHRDPALILDEVGEFGGGGGLAGPIDAHQRNNRGTVRTSNQG